MENEATNALPDPRWRRIADLPLVAMSIAVASFILVVAVARQLGRLLPPMGADAAGMGKTLIAIALMFAIYKLVIARLGEQPRDDLPLAAAPRGLALGLALGFLLFSAIVASADLLGIYRVVGRGDTRQLVHDLADMTLFAGFMEELLFRGILFRWIERIGGSAAAIAITSLLFGLAHLFNANATWTSSLAISVEAGVMLGGAYMLVRNLWVPIGLHAAWNFTQGFLFDVPVSGEDVHGLVQAKLVGPSWLSGGAFGLEASAISVLLCLPFGIVLIVLAVRRDGSGRSWWRYRGPGTGTRTGASAGLGRGHPQGPPGRPRPVPPFGG